MLVSVVTVNDAELKDGELKVSLASFENPYDSVGIPKMFLSKTPFLLRS
jgi:hypothetical protein